MLRKELQQKSARRVNSENAYLKKRDNWTAFLGEPRIQLQMQSALFRYLDPPHRRYFLLALLVAAATILAYQPAWHGGFIWDDDSYITNNELLTAPDGLRRIWFSLDSPSQYFPLVYTMFRFEHSWWGLNPTGYHVVNILLHIANALLLWGLLARLRVPGAWLAGAIFALHPVQVESVAWITERKNVLMGLFLSMNKRSIAGFFTVWHWCSMRWRSSVKRLPALSQPRCS